MNLLVAIYIVGGSDGLEARRIRRGRALGAQWRSMLSEKRGQDEDEGPG